ncbi:hypothetical protein [Bordetella sp. LUAb4]|uniref:hypothetical protein n=1 Tax=Bordetella sp. LUAb4 TaxID=2843195 RepID=UPI001E3ED4D9|nr:hypothetical protein [Bordetella sp. LUAb4]
MNRVALALSVCVLAGCASQSGKQADIAQYGTPPSDEDLHQYMSSLRDTLPPTRYVTYRDHGYDASVKKATFTDQDGQPMMGWEYDFDVATYDTVDAKPPPQYRPYRAVFFNGRPVGILDANGRFIRGGLQDQVPVPPSPPPGMPR